MRRRRRTAEEIRGICTRFLESKQTQREFAGEEGISVGSLRNWLRRTALSPAVRGAHFVEVTPRAVVTPSSHLRTELPCGVALICGEFPEPGYLAQLIRELRAP